LVSAAILKRIFLDFRRHRPDPSITVVVARVRILGTVPGDEAFDLSVHPDVARHTPEEMAPSMVRLHSHRNAETVHSFADPFGYPGLGLLSTDGQVLDPRSSAGSMWWIKASIQGYILRSWSLVKMGSSAAQKKLFFRLRRTKAEISALEDGDLRPEHTAKIAKRLGVQENDVVEMNRRLCGDVSLITLVHTDEAGEVQDWLVDPASSPEAVYAEQEEAKLRRQASGCGKSKFARLKRFRLRYAPDRRTRLHDATVKQRRGSDCRGPEAVPGG
jgi:hypothetical protein